MSNLKFKGNSECETLFSEKKNKLFLFLLLLGTMSTFYLCNLQSAYINERCDTYSLLQVPIIIGACAGGPLIGTILAVIGSTMSMLYSSFSSTYIDVLNSPFASFDTSKHHFIGNISSIFICFLSNIALALIASWIFKALKNHGQTIWKIVLVAISATFGILFFHIVVFFLFNLFFVNFLPNVECSRIFVSDVNSTNWLACFSELRVNIIIDPLIVYAARMIMNLD